MRPTLGGGLPSPEYYEKPKVLQEYLEAVARVFEGLHPRKPGSSSARKMARAVVELESSVAAIIPPVEDLYNVTVGFPHG